MRTTALALAAFLLVANVRCLLACETPRQVVSSCHQRQQPEPDDAQQICVGLAVVKADGVETGVVAYTAATNVAPKAPEFTRPTPLREPSLHFSGDRGLYTVLKI